MSRHAPPIGAISEGGAASDLGQGRALLSPGGEEIRIRYFEDFVVGEVDRPEGTYLLTEEEIVEVGTRWDPQPFHVDAVAAADTMFGGLVASSVHLFAIGTCLGVNAQSTAAVSSLGFRSVANHAPARPGDRLSVRTTNIEARLSRSRPGCGILTALLELTNQDGEVVFSYENAALIQCRPDAEPPD